jgi:hypothetical protein
MYASQNQSHLLIKDYRYQAIAGYNIQAGKEHECQTILP